MKEIDWASWKSKIITKGLVDKVNANFDEMNEHEYELDRIFTDIFSRDSKAIDEIVLSLNNLRIAKWHSTLQYGLTTMPITYHF